MPKSLLDYDSLLKKVSNKTYRLSEVKNRIEKVAFDLVRFKDSNSNELWQIQQADDGQYIVAKYSDQDEATKAAAANNPWEVMVNKSAGWVSIYFGGTPIVKLAASKLNLQNEDLDTVRHVLPKKLATDQKFVDALLDMLDKQERESIAKLIQSRTA